MGELINGKMPEHVKAGLRCRVIGDVECSDCAYYGTVLYEIGQREYECDDVDRDALALIEHLESERDAALAKVPRWISVYHRVPENEKPVLITGWRKGISGKLWPVVMTAFHMDGKMLAQDSSYSWSEGNVEMEYDEDADDFIVPEGWFEDVQCADEFSMVGDIRITHWMPLPEPPEEGE